MISHRGTGNAGCQCEETAPTHAVHSQHTQGLVVQTCPTLTPRAMETRQRHGVTDFNVVHSQGRPAFAPRPARALRLQCHDLEDARYCLNITLYISISALENTLDCYLIYTIITGLQL